jgi:hypothetical protein
MWTPDPVAEDAMTLVQPDVAEAAREQAEVVAAARGMLRRRTGPAVAALLDPDGGLDLRCPAAFSVAFALPDPDARPGTAEADDAVRALAGTVAAHAGRSTAVAGGWAVDLAPPEPHLRHSVARAVDQAPRLPGRERPDVRVAGWASGERRAAVRAAELVRDAFPAMFAEMSLVVRQVALLEGRGIAGFTDFGVMGAIMINRGRFGAASDGMPGPVRFAESLVHEATHARCNAAGWSAPYLARQGDRALTVRTPLRPDPRPLNGLFQQLVVLLRSAGLYARMTARPVPELAGDALDAARARRDTLLAQAGEAAATLGEHRSGLSARGAAELDAARLELDDPLAGLGPGGVAEARDAVAGGG